MNLSLLKTSIIKACVNIDTSHLYNINDKAYYSSKNKQELIEEFEQMFKRIPKQLTGLIYKISFCNYCYKGCETQAFYDLNENIIFSFIVKVDVFEEDTQFFIVQECKNKPILNSDSNYPF